MSENKLVISGNEELKILTPFNVKMEEIQNDTVQTADCIINKSTYPNGVILEMCQKYDRIEIKCNKELIDNNDGTISIKL